MNLKRIPQTIDPHVHFRVPGLEYKEDWDAGTLAAVAGGYTTVLEMPNTKPPTLSEELLEQKRRIASKSAHCNFGLIFGSSVDNLAEIKKVIGKVVAVKVFFNLSTGNLKIDDEKKLKKIFLATPLVIAHAEGEQLEKAIWLTRQAGNNLYVAHVPGIEEIELIKKAKADLNIFAEVTPHHLFLDKPQSVDPTRLMMPALRNKKHQEALWQAVLDGTIDTLGTDHAPHTAEDKQQLPPPFGVPGLETALPLMLNAVNERRLSFEKLIELASINPAKIFKINTSKDNYTEVDFDLQKQVDNANLFTKCGWSPWHGQTLKGWPTKTVINGVTVFEQGQIVNNHQGQEITYGH
ncbi:MAG: dihydroorotase [Candidatus Buchananbacteria bacterium CG10_big_fil_rev_8_21_14_0_10_42_9]|uniref:Dihydroorotase n=1 Tax=Candidatus Buchananbacteria bacterium CG10_big_fil_rev_8_21_14_0_10_42_9 TaxID=1974526 RepID=A0A2H0W2N5_9BACT|nr:MAG: dihydroorotase [Candidatus Buchananbacteria bacterium CG10_big_fil_rev_8_21_14_0_10_42_9]